MSTARSVAIADAVVTALNAGTFSQSFTAQRVYSIAGELDNLTDLTVLVVPARLDLDVAAGDRGGPMRDIVVHIGVLQKLTKADNDEIDPLLEVVEELADATLAIRVGSPPAACVDCQTVPLFDPDHLDKHRQFTSVLALTFRVLH